jgi:hypothetical protein
MYDQPGVRVPVTFPGQGVEAKDPIAHGAPAVVEGKVGFLAFNKQLGRFVDPTSDEATFIQPGDGCEIFIGGTHRLALAGPLAGAAVGDKLYITAENEVLRNVEDAGTNEKQSVKVDGTGGTHRLEFDGELTDKLAPALTAAELLAEMEELGNIQPGDLEITGGPGGAGGTTPYIFIFKGQYEDTDVPVLISVEEELTGGGAAVTITTTVAGVAGAAVFPLGVIDKVDTAPTPDLAYVNTNALASFITV